MIVSESDVLLSALDRRLQIDRIVALEPASVFDDASGDPATGTQPARSAPTSSAYLDRLPLGQVFDARVVSAEGGDVIAELGALRIALSWPNSGSPAPVAGAWIALRVLAHEPALLFQNVPADGAEPDDDADAPLRLSTDARSLQSAASSGAGTVRFTVPIVDVSASHAAAVASRGSTDPAPNLFAVGDPSFDRDSPAQGSVARVVTVDASVQAQAGLPLVLQGPAWSGQDVELVVRRERRDEAFDNPALDQWCGELVIDLPTLGRVSSHLAWSVQGLRIRLEGQEPASVASMTETATELAQALSAVDLPVIAVSVRQPGTVAVSTESLPRG